MNILAHEGADPSVQQAAALALRRVISFDWHEDDPNKPHRLPVEVKDYSKWLVKRVFLNADCRQLISPPILQFAPTLSLFLRNRLSSLL